MKSYKSYMDRITLDSAIKHRIIGQLEKTSDQAVTPAWRGNALPLAGAAVCVAVIALAVWLLPFSRNDQPGFPADAPPAETLPANTPPADTLVSNGSSNEQTSESPTNLANDDETPDPAIPAFEIHDLIFNAAYDMAYLEIELPEGSFSCDLTFEQLQRVSPAVSAIIYPEESLANHSFLAIACYSAGGILDYVLVREQTMDLDTHPLKTEIRLAEGKVPEGGETLFYEGEAIISDVHGIPVTALMYESDWGDGEVFLSAEFMIGDLAHLVRIHGYDLAAERERMTKIVNALITAPTPMDLDMLANPVIPLL